MTVARKKRRGGRLLLAIGIPFVVMVSAAWALRTRDGQADQLLRSLGAEPVYKLQATRVSTHDIATVCYYTIQEPTAKFLDRFRKAHPSSEGWTEHEVTASKWSRDLWHDRVFKAPRAIHGYEVAVVGQGHMDTFQSDPTNPGFVVPPQVDSAYDSEWTTIILYRRPSILARAEDWVQRHLFGGRIPKTIMLSRSTKGQMVMAGIDPRFPAEPAALGHS